MTGAPVPASAPPLLAALAGRPPARRPVWFMRQAGRSLPEYRRVRSGVPMLAACLTPDLAAEITLQPVRRHGVDAAILFSDIVVPLKAAGVALDIVPGRGPVLERPVRTAADVAALPPLRPGQLEPVAEAARLAVAELGSTPLIGFAGAPFTLASYLVEGGPSRAHARAKALMHAEPALWHELAGRLAEMSARFLLAQIDAGAAAVQLFDSWAGALAPAEYREFALPHSRRVFEAVAGRVPTLHFGVGTGELLADMAAAGASAVGVDWRVPLDEAARRLAAAGRAPAVQGNLDPALLLAGWPVVERAARRVCAAGDAAVALGAAGHVFNLGHGVLPETDPGVLTDLVALVHSL